MSSCLPFPWCIRGGHCYPTSVIVIGSQSLGNSVLLWTVKFSHPIPMLPCVTLCPGSHTSFSLINIAVIWSEDTTYIIIHLLIYFTRFVTFTLSHPLHHLNVVSPSIYVTFHIYITWVTSTISHHHFMSPSISVTITQTIAISPSKYPTLALLQLLPHFIIYLFYLTLFLCYPFLFAATAVSHRSPSQSSIMDAQQTTQRIHNTPALMWISTWNEEDSLIVRRL